VFYGRGHCDRRKKLKLSECGSERSADDIRRGGGGVNILLICDIGGAMYAYASQSNSVSTVHKNCHPLKMGSIIQIRRNLYFSMKLSVYLIGEGDGGWLCGGKGGGCSEEANK
jgi:hypothetical protein